MVSHMQSMQSMHSDHLQLSLDGLSEDRTATDSPASQPMRVRSGLSALGKNTQRSPASPAFSIRSGDSPRSEKAKQKGGVGSNFIKAAEIDTPVIEKTADPKALARRAKRGASISNFMVLVVLVDSFCTCRDIDARAGGGQPPDAIWILTDTCLALYCLEMIVMLSLRGWQTLKEVATQVDILIIGCGLAEKALSLFWVQQDNAITSLVRVLRLVRIFRITRLLQRTKALRELSKLVSMMATCLKALVWSFIFCFVIMTVWAMLMVEFVHPLIQELNDKHGTFEGCPQCTRATSSVMSANLLLFKTVIAGDSWGEIAVPVIERYPMTAIVFMGSLLTLVFGVLNLIVAVVVDTFAEYRQRDVIHLAEDLEVDLANDQKILQRMFERIDEDGSGLVSYEELVEGARKDPEFQSRLRVMDIDESDLRQFFDMIDSTGEGEIESSEFIAALSRWVHDSKTAPRFVKYNVLRSLQMQEELYETVHEQFEMLSSRLDYSDYALESILKGSGLFAGVSPQSSPSESRQFFTQDDAEIDQAVTRLLEAEAPEQPHRSLAPVTLATELKDLKDLKESANPNRPSVGETGALDSLDELRTTNTFEDAKVDSGFDDVAESNVGANHSASAAVAQVEHLVLRATEAALKRSLANLESTLQGLTRGMAFPSQGNAQRGRHSISMQNSMSLPMIGMNSLGSSRPPASYQRRRGSRGSKMHSAELRPMRKSVRMPVGTFSPPGASMSLGVSIQGRRASRASAGENLPSHRSSLHSEHEAR